MNLSKKCLDLQEFNEILIQELSLGIYYEQEKREKFFSEISGDFDPG